MNWREEWKRHGRPKVRRGTPPTPEDPAPSNQTIRDYPTGISIISTGNLTPQVCAEYEAAIAAHPDDAGLRLSYGELLTFASRLDDALPQLQAAVRLSPGDSFAHGASRAVFASWADWTRPRRSSANPCASFWPRTARGRSRAKRLPAGA